MSMPNDSLYCKNCNHLLTESDKFCSQCGQEIKGNLTVGVLFNNTINNYFSVDARFFVSFIPLIFRPGYLPRKFIEGKRLTYLHPAQFYLFISVVFFFLFSIEASVQQEQFDKNIKENLAKIDNPDTTDLKVLDSINALTIKKVNEVFQENNIAIDSNIIAKPLINVDLSSNNDEKTKFFGVDKSKLDSLIAVEAPLEEKLKVVGYKETMGLFRRKAYSQLIKIYEKKGSGFLKAFLDTIPVAMFFLLPFFAFLLKLMYYKKGSYAYHLVFSLYYFSFIFIVFSILLLLNMLFSIPSWINTWTIILTVVYLVIAIRNFFMQKYIGAFFKTAFILFIYFNIIIPFSIVLLIAVSLFIY